eukprot:s25_g29.t1
MKFLHAIWPQDYIEYLAPRAALLIEGSAFQKVARLDPAKLRTAQGVQYLVESIGGQWGRPWRCEEKYDLFQRALYTAQQRSDETNDSYLARHDIAFEDLQAKSVSIDDIRAYVLVRQSTLSSEDRKKIIMENSGKLTYEGARKSMRLLGSKFFQDLQNAGRGGQNKKTYDAYQLDEDEETQHVYMGERKWDLAQCFVSYQEARARVKERARSRGFWPLKGGKTKGKGFTKKGKNQGGFGGGSNSFSGFKKRSLAERIANSTCRVCGAAGHWKRECPLRQQESRKTESSAAMPNDVHLGFLEEDIAMDEVTMELPDDVVDWKEENGQVIKICCVENFCEGFSGVCDVVVGENCSLFQHERFKTKLKARLSHVL